MARCKAFSLDGFGGRYVGRCPTLLMQGFQPNECHPSPMALDLFQNSSRNGRACPPNVPHSTADGLASHPYQYASIVRLVLEQVYCANTTLTYYNGARTFQSVRMLVAGRTGKSVLLCRRHADCKKVSA